MSARAVRLRVLGVATAVVFAAAVVVVLPRVAHAASPSPAARPGAATGARTSPPVQLPEPPDTMAGHPVTQEDISEALKGASKNQYLDAVSLWSVRDQDTQLLLATLQIGHFRSGSAYGSPDFRRQVAGQVGTSVPVEENVGGHTVYVSSTRTLRLAVWFDGRFMYVLTMRASFDQPKELIREALEVR